MVSYIDDAIDDAVTGLMLENLRETFDFESWKAELDLYAGDFRRERQGMEAQVEQLKKVMDKLLLSLATLTHLQMIAAAEKQYTEAQQEHDRLLRELSASREEEGQRGDAMQNSHRLSSSFSSQ